MERRRYTGEFKLEAVRLIRDRGVSYAQASQDLKVHPTQLGNWVKENPGGSAVEVFKKVQELGIEKKHKAVQVLAQTLFTDDIISEIPGYLPIFQKVRGHVLSAACINEVDDRRW